MEHALIEEALLNEFFSIMGFDSDSVPELGFKHLHRWLYSTPSNTVKEYADLRPRNLNDRNMISREDNSESLFLKAENEEIYAVGDYILGSLGVEASLLSARALARILCV